MRNAFSLFLLAIYVWAPNSAQADVYVDAKAKALAVMVMNVQAAKAPHNWCHCGNCEAIADATAEATVIMKTPTKKESVICECKDCDCGPGQCPACPDYSWKKRLSDPGRWYLYDGAKLIGAYDVASRYYRPYDAAADRWGPKSACPAAAEKIAPPRPQYVQSQTKSTISAAPCSSCNNGAGLFRRR